MCSPVYAFIEYWYHVRGRAIGGREGATRAKARAGACRRRRRRAAGVRRGAGWTAGAEGGRRRAHRTQRNALHTTCPTFTDQQHNHCRAAPDARALYRP